MYSHYSFTMERERRRTLIQAIFICSVLIYSVNSDCTGNSDCNSGVCDNNKCLCEDPINFGDNCEKTCDTDCNTDDFHCETVTVINKVDHTVCVCKDTNFEPVDETDITQGCKRRRTETCATECKHKDNLECKRDNKENKCQCQIEFLELEKGNILAGCFHQHNCDDCTAEGLQCTEPPTKVECICKDKHLPIGKDILMGCYHEDNCTGRCLNGGTCNSTTKECMCSFGFSGHNCGVKCSDKCTGENVTCDASDQLDETTIECKCIEFHKKEIGADLNNGGSCYMDPCVGNSCSSGSTCTDVAGIAKCQCPAKVFGDLCEIPCEDRCNPEKKLDCQSDNSVSVPDGFKCVCIENFIQKDMSKNIEEVGCREDVCKTNACKNNADCVNAVCECKLNLFFGELCEISCQDVCPHKDVVCNANADDPQNSKLVSCDCKQGYNRTDSTKPKDCYKDLCKEQSACTGGNGVCSQEKDQVACRCSSGYFGKQCESSCKSDKCNNHPNTECTVPVPPSNEVTCKCMNGFRTITLDKPEDMGCIKDLCGMLLPHHCNHGNCTDDMEAVLCKCEDDYFGELCNERCTDRCNKQVHTKCTNDGKCECEDGFIQNSNNVSRDGCRKKLCKDDSCVNGTCSDEEGFVKCTCNTDFFGKACADACDTKCAASKHLKCIKDASKAEEENIAECVCEDNTFIPINKTNIATEGCRQDVCKINSCNSAGTKECKAVSDKEYRCICQANYYGRNCDKICRKPGLCDKPNLMCEPAKKDDSDNAKKCVCLSNYVQIGTAPETEGCSKKCDKNSQCGANATCTNNVCKCNNTFTLSGDICYPDSAPCPCQNGGHCVKTAGQSKCKCADEFGGANCEIICDSICGGNAKCVDGDISKCTCKDAYTNVPTTDKPRNCVFDICNAEKPCKNNGICTMLHTGEYSCKCSEEYIDRNCEVTCENKCGSNVICNSNPKIPCDRCIEGFVNLERPPNFNCVKDLCINEKCNGNGKCRMANATNKTCVCKSPFKGDFCECNTDSCTPGVCGSGRTCIPSSCNSYTCVCFESKQQWNGTECVAVNECEYISCPALRECREGKCQCKPGHKDLGNNKCEDKFDICGTSSCPDNSTCVNDDPSYQCKCDKDYYFDITTKTCKRFNCEDICPYRSCNPNGSCKCPEHFQESGGKCVPKNGTCTKTCGQNSVCFVAEDKDNCLCLSGYQMKDNACVDIDECILPQFKESCSPGECFNETGSYKCLCEPNDYDEAHKACVAVNECHSKTKPHNCDLQSTTCEDLPKGFKCECKTYYEKIVGANTTCKREDTCKNDKCNGEKCQFNEYRKNGYECICPLTETYDYVNMKCVKANQIYPGQIKLRGTFDKHLTNSSSQEYQKMKTEVEIALSDTLKTSSGKNVMVIVIGFKDGSIIAEYVVYSDEPLSSDAAKEMWRKQCHDLAADKLACVLGETTKIVVVTDYFDKNGTNLIEHKCSAESEIVCDAGNANCFPNPTKTSPFACSCKPGYELIHSSSGIDVCADKNECLNATACKEPTECNNTLGSFECNCKSGFMLVNEECKKICEVNPCGEGTCIELLPNNYRCECNVGYKGANCEQKNAEYKAAFMGWEIAVGILAAAFVFCLIISCLIIHKLKKKLKHNAPLDDSQLNEYASVGHKSIFCRHFDFRKMTQLWFFPLIINIGFGHGLDMQALPNNRINESLIVEDNFSVLCEFNHCLNNGICMKNEIGNATEIFCICAVPFYGAQCQCRSDLCTIHAHNCGFELKCISLCHQPACYCPREGFTADLTTKNCVDIDECAILDVCREPNEICNNFPGSYSCDCVTGYVRNPITSQCIDIDECQLPEVCGLHGICENSPGIFQCSCESGFEGIPCEDYDECARGMSTCEQICINTNGSYNCTCFDEFLMENETCVYSRNASCSLQCGRGGCVDNSCVCNMGFQFDNNTLTCNDVDECESESSCSANAICINSEGGYSCECLEGFEMKMGNCIDINECAILHRCGPAGFCINYPGNFTCLCVGGYELIDGICKEIDECIHDKGGETCLTINAECVDGINGFVCRCRPGFYMNNKFCIPAKTTLTGQLTLAKTFDMLLYIKNSQAFRKLSHQLESLLTVLAAEDLVEVHILNFRPGSTIANYVVMTQSNLDYVNFNNKLFAACQTYGAKPDMCLLSNNIAIENHTLLQTSSMHFNACSTEYVNDYCPTFMTDCVNLENGQFKCVCKTGFHMRASSNNIPLCIDVNECNQTVSRCSNTQICHNTFGSYSCNCIDGFYQHEEECLLLCKPNPCKNDGKCIIIGKNDFTCECHVNFMGAYCELPNKHLIEATNLLYIVTGVLAAILFMSVLVGCLCCREIKKHSKVEVERVTRLFSKYYDNEAVN
uniref:EGF-like domain-containing protein n=1 Tax=Strigamia maritima TaxID=126957 RepID=T1IVS8_STRMM